jgi:hypothetical protein
MLRPSTDTAYDTIWRQLVRWLAAPSPGPVALPAMAVASPGDVEPVSVTVRNRRFAPVVDASVTLTITDPDGATRRFDPTLQDPRAGRHAGPVRFEHAGVYRVDAEARSGETALGTATRYVLVGGTDIEMADLALNEPVLQRLAAATGGRYLQADQAAELGSLLRADEPDPATEMRDLWHNAWTLLGIMGVLAAEWMVRRRVGLA